MNGEISAAFRIQLAVGGSDHSIAAAQLSGDLLLSPDNELTILSVLTPGRPPGKSRLQAALAQAEKILEGTPVKKKSP